MQPTKTRSILYKGRLGRYFSLHHIIFAQNANHRSDTCCVLNFIFESEQLQLRTPRCEAKDKWI